MHSHRRSMSDSDISPQFSSKMSISDYKKIIQDADNYFNDNFTYIAIDEIAKLRADFFDTLLLHLWECAELTSDNISQRCWWLWPSNPTSSF